MYKVEKFRSEKNKEHYFRVVAENGNIICSSEGYKNKKDRDDIADSLPFAMNAILMRDVKSSYGFKDINSTEFAAYMPENFYKEMNRLNWFKFPMYKIYILSPETGKETFFLNDRTGKSGLYNAIEKESMVEKLKYIITDITRIEEINVEDFKKEMEV